MGDDRPCQTIIAKAEIEAFSLFFMSASATMPMELGNAPARWPSGIYSHCDPGHKSRVRNDGNNSFAPSRTEQKSLGGRLHSL